MQHVPGIVAVGSFGFVSVLTQFRKRFCKGLVKGSGLTAQGL